VSEDSSLAKSLGITDRESGIRKAGEAKLRLIRFASEALPSSFAFGVAEMTLMSALTRAQAFHEGTLDALASDNPFAAFTLLRGYAENAAMLVWLLEKPVDIERFYPGATKEMRISVGRLTNKAPSRFGGFRGIYDQLSGFAHPAAASALSGWHSSDESLRVEWASKPAFKNDDDFMIVCVWLVELAQANAHLWREVWEQYFGESPKFTPPEWKFGASSAARAG
jgi:hypothetical protein